MLNKMERQVSLCPTFPLSLFFTFICLLSLFKQLLGFSKLFWLLWQNQNNAIRIMLMLGRELPSVPKVDNFAAVEMLASKRHQNPRQVKYKSIDSLTKGWAPTITVSRVCSHFPMLHIFIAEGVLQFFKRTHFRFLVISTAKRCS